ncbi:MAG: NfeD family protein, partial [Bryobacteraceae bacterium]|nr:NfeD family protein [Bryobacteraceae bacterium]
MATKFYHLVVIGTLALSLCAGLAGASIVFWFLRKVLMRDREELDPADYDMVGVLGRVSENIRREGLGEVLFSQAGTRRSVAARSEDDNAIPNGTEVVVTRYENGIAYVRRWDELAEIADAHPGGN